MQAAAEFCALLLHTELCVCEFKHKMGWREKASYFHSQQNCKLSIPEEKEGETQAQTLSTKSISQPKAFQPARGVTSSITIKILWFAFFIYFQVWNHLVGQIWARTVTICKIRLLLLPSPFCRDCESLCNTTEVLLKNHREDARQIQIILVTIIWLETLPTPTFAETEKQQKLSHMADPWTTACCSVRMSHHVMRRIQPLPQNHYNIIRWHLVVTELDNNHPLPNTTVIPTHAIWDWERGVIPDSHPAPPCCTGALAEPLWLSLQGGSPGESWVCSLPHLQMEGVPALAQYHLKRRKPD